MLNDGTPFSKIYLKPGKTDLRKGIDGLAAIVKSQIGLDPFQKNVLFLFCGGSPSKIKGLVWEGDGFLLLYKRCESGHYQWPKNTAEAKALQLCPDQLRDLLNGFSIVQKCTVRGEVHPEGIA